MLNRRTTGSRKGLALTTLCAGSFLAVLDTTIVTIALPSIRRDMGFSDTGAQWILNGYTLAFGGLLLLLGRLGDLLGRRRLYVWGLTLFALVSLVAGMAPVPWVLVVARALQGACGAALVPASLSLVTVMTEEGEERNRALGIYGAMAAIGFVCGMVGGGVITEFLGWRWIFLASVAPSLIVAAVAQIVVTESRDEHASRTLDVGGAISATAGLVAFI